MSRHWRSSYIKGHRRASMSLRLNTHTPNDSQESLCHRRLANLVDAAPTLESACQLRGCSSAIPPHVPTCIHKAYNSNGQKKRHLDTSSAPSCK
eukprot:609884-Pelagomonas_calceolata.AAC.8